MLWRDTSGNISMWFMNGTLILSGADHRQRARPVVDSVPATTTATARATLLWRDTAGDVAIWFMNGTQVLSRPDLGTVPTSWTILGRSTAPAAFSGATRPATWRSGG